MPRTLYRFAHTLGTAEGVGDISNEHRMRFGHDYLTTEAVRNLLPAVFYGTRKGATAWLIGAVSMSDKGGLVHPPSHAKRGFVWVWRTNSGGGVETYSRLPPRGVWCCGANGRVGGKMVSWELQFLTGTLTKRVVTKLCVVCPWTGTLCAL